MSEIHCLFYNTNIDKMENNNIHTKENLRQLYKQAQEYLTTGEFQKKPITELYRNKPESYFNDIKDKHNNIMKPYLKDRNGDPKSPINLRINGLFFSGLQPSPGRSHFGDRRLYVTASRIIKKENRFYFADFYCRRTHCHYVTIVVTHPGSQTDQFCRDHLMELDISPGCQDDFISLSPDGTIEMRMFTFFRGNNQLYVEIYYTEEIDVTKELTNGGSLVSYAVTRNCSSNGVGFPKNSSCDKCNLRRVTENTEQSTPSSLKRARSNGDDEDGPDAKKSALFSL